MDDGDLVIAGKYHVVELIAQGGMGAVYDAIHAKTGRRVALKLIKERGLSRGPAALRRFEREAKTAGAIDSLHVVQVLDAGEDEASGMPFFVMEHLQGEDLRSVIARGPLRPDQAIAIARQVCRGLIKAHEAQIIHRDLKPANLFLAEAEGGRRVVKILDFGIAKLLDEQADTPDLTTTGEMVGSPPYMSPEQLGSPRDVDARSDLWSLGVVLYEMLSGATPTAGISAIGARVYAICHVPATPLAEQVPGLRPDLAAVVHRALARDPAERFASAQEMLEALCALQPRVSDQLDGAPTSLRASAFSTALPGALELAVTEDERAPSPPSRARVRGRVLWAAAAVALAVAATGGAYLAREGQSSAAARASGLAPITATTTATATGTATTTAIATATSTEPAAPAPAPSPAPILAPAPARASARLPVPSAAGSLRKPAAPARSYAAEADAGGAVPGRLVPRKLTGREKL